MAQPLQKSLAQPDLVFWPTSLVLNLLQVQQLHWQALVAWQETMADTQQDLYDSWASHWAGAARLDD